MSFNTRHPYSTTSEDVFSWHKKLIISSFTYSGDIFITFWFNSLWINGHGADQKGEEKQVVLFNVF